MLLMVFVVVVEEMAILKVMVSGWVSMHKKCPSLSLLGHFLVDMGPSGATFHDVSKRPLENRFLACCGHTSGSEEPSKHRATREQGKHRASTEPAQSQHRASTIAQRMPSKHRTAIEQESNREQEPRKTLHCSPDGGGGCVANGV